MTQPWTGPCREQHDVATTLCALPGTSSCSMLAMVTPFLAERLLTLLQWERQRWAHHFIRLVPPLDATAETLQAASPMDDGDHLLSGSATLLTLETHCRLQCPTIHQTTPLVPNMSICMLRWTHGPLSVHWTAADCTDLFSGVSVENICTAASWSTPCPCSFSRSVLN